MNSENIFDIWRYLGKGTPFVVRRNGWFHLSYMVTEVKPKGQYGEAYGYRLIDGKPENGNTVSTVIECCGCGNWELIENLIEDVESLKWNCLDDNGKITFGKYKGLTPDELKEKDEDYLNWALSNIGGLFEKLFIDKHNVTRKELLDTKKQIKSKLSFSSDDWIKSSVQVNYDSYLDRYKYSCCAKKMDIETAVNEIERYFQASK